MSDLPLAYHITFGTYGTRLHGDPRGSVARTQPAPGSVYIDEDGLWEKIEKKLLEFEPVELDENMRHFIERQIPEICERGIWMYINAAAQTDHVHVLLSAYVDGKAVRRWLKRWLGEALSERYPRAFRRRPNKNPSAKPTWWAEGGCIKHVWDESYLETAYQYIEQQRSSRTL